MSDGAGIIKAGEKHFRTAEPAAGAEVDYEKNSTSALSAIRDSLDYHGAASTEGMNGSEPPSPQTADFAGLVPQGLGLSDAASSTAAVDRLGLSVDSSNGVLGNLTGGSALATKGEAEWSDKLYGEPTVQDASSGELSFPKLAERLGDQDVSDPTWSIRSGDSTASSSGPRYDSDADEERLSTRVYPVGDLVLPVQTPMGGMGMGGMGGMGGGMGGGEETHDAANKRLAALGLGVRSTQKERPGIANINTLDESGNGRDESRRLSSDKGISQRVRGRGLGRREDAVQHFSSGESGQGDGSSRGQLLNLEVRVRETSEDVENLPAAGRNAEKYGSAAEGEDVVGGGLGVGGGGLGGFGLAGKTLADERKSGSKPKRNAPPATESGRSVDERGGTAPSQPLVAGTSGGTEGKEAEGASSDEVLGTGGRANSLTSPTTEPVLSREVLENNGRIAASERYKEDLAKESVSMAIPGGITLPKIHTRDGNENYSRQISKPLTGTAMGQPLGGLEGVQSKQDSRWDYAQNSTRDFHRRWEKETDQRAPITRGGVTYENETRVKNSRGELPALRQLDENTKVVGDLLLDDYDTKVGQKEKDPQPRPKDQQDELLRQRGRRYAITGGSHWYGYVPPMLEDNSESMKKARVNRLTAPAGLNEKTAEDEAFSTFSLHVSDVSFKLARAALANGQWPEAAKVRIEEFVNAFDYGDPMPTLSEKVSCRLEQSIHPFLQQRNLLRVSMRTAAAGRSNNTPLRLTFLLDNSGSMERIDRQQTVRRAFALLAQQLKPIDQVTLISFARQPRLLADKVSGHQSHQLLELIADLPSEGGTNIEAALQLAFEKAKEQQVDGAQNRIILLTDGAVNLGDANPESLSRMVTTMRSEGIAFDAAGICAEGLNDEVLEALTRKGDGRYYLLDSLEAADDGFARQIAGALRPSAKNVKVQVEFNPKRVGRYKLLGFEKHRLNQEDFRNDSVDAAEMAAAEAGVAMYQFEAKPDGEGDVGSVSVRFRDLSTGQMIENRWPIPYEAAAPRPDQAAPSLRIATSAALLAAKLRGGPLGETVDLKTLSDLIAGLPDRDRNADRVQQLHQMIQQARQVSGG